LRPSVEDFTTASVAFESAEAEELVEDYLIISFRKRKEKRKSDPLVAETADLIVDTRNALRKLSVSKERIIRL